MTATLAQRTFLLALAVVWAISTTQAAEPDRRLVNAAADQDWSAVSALISAGVDVDSARADGATALLWTTHWEALTPLYVKTRVQAAWMSSWRARKSVMTRW